MAFPHFYLTSQVLSQEQSTCFALDLLSDDLKHARVLRLAPGEHIAVIDASSDYFECEVVSFEEKLVVKISTHLHSFDDAFPCVVLAQGLAKGDKMDTIIRHATELGVRRFIPFSSERCVMKLDEKRAGKKVERWNAIAKSAAMQSGQPCIPKVELPCSLEQLGSAIGDVDILLICWEEATQTESLKKALQSFALQDSPVTVAVVVGPEGGLSEKEVKCLMGSHPNATLVSLGSSILRTETAGIVAPALVIYELGGFELSHSVNSVAEK